MLKGILAIVVLVVAGCTDYGTGTSYFFATNDAGMPLLPRGCLDPMKPCVLKENGSGTPLCPPCMMDFLQKRGAWMKAHDVVDCGSEWEPEPDAE